MMFEESGFKECGMKTVSQAAETAAGAGWRFGKKWQAIRSKIDTWAWVKKQTNRQGSGDEQVDQGKEEKKKHREQTNKKNPECPQTRINQAVGSETQDDT